jgi:hypothetical protein
MTVTSEATSGVDPKVVERIRKLLALTVNPNGNEAAVAAVKAQELLDKFNLEMADIGGWYHHNGVEHKVGIVEDRFQYAEMHSPLKAWKIRLAQTLCNNNNINLLLNKTSFYFIGEATNVEVVKVLYQWLVSQLELAAVPAWKIYKANCAETGEHREDPLVFRNSFFSGANGSISQRMYDRKQALLEESRETMTAIVRVHTAAIEEFIEDRYGKNLKSVKGHRTNRFSGSAYAAGKVAGDQVNLGDKGELNI